MRIKTMAVRLAALTLVTFPVLAASGASAAVITATYKGVFAPADPPPVCPPGTVGDCLFVTNDPFQILSNQSKDFGGVFGPAGASLAGVSFSLTFTYDLSKETDFLIQPHTTGASGGSIVGGDPFGAYALTVNGVTVDGTGREDGHVSVSNDTGYVREDFVSQFFNTQHGPEVVVRPFGVFVDVDAEVPPTTYDIASPVTFDFNPQTPNGEFSFYVDVRGARPDTGPDAEAKLLIQSLTVDFSDGATPPTDPPPVDPPPSGGEPPITGVPEPAAWAMLVLGFGGLGAVLRRQRGLQALA